MAETTVYSHLLALGLISIVLNSLFLLPLAGLIVTSVVYYVVSAGYPAQQTFPIIGSIFYIGFFLFSVAFSIVAIIGSILGFMYNDSIRKFGFKMLKIIHAIMAVFFVVNIIFLIVGSILVGANYGAYYTGFLLVTVIMAPFICVFQCGLLGYGTLYTCVIGNSFELRREETLPIYQDTRAYVETSFHN